MVAYNKSMQPSNCDVHWLSVTKAELLAALSTAAGHSIPTNATLEVDDDGDVLLTWQTPKEQA